MLTLICFCFMALLGCRAGVRPENTPTTLPTLTPFTVPEIAEILLQTGDLPARSTSSELNYRPHPVFSTMPPAQYFIGMQFLQGTQFAGRVSIFIYPDPTDMDSAWPVALSTLNTPKEVTSVGELAAVNFSDMVFIRCTALVHIKLSGTQPDEVRIYAEQLDARLKPRVCPKSGPN